MIGLLKLNLKEGSFDLLSIVAALKVIFYGVVAVCIIYVVPLKCL